ncbi:unnamed protein product, partial [Amoebophrya sp. A25]|eukprot:GSA25T00020252001.1
MRDGEYLPVGALLEQGATFSASGEKTQLGAVPLLLGLEEEDERPEESVGRDATEKENRNEAISGTNTILELVEVERTLGSPFAFVRKTDTQVSTTASSKSLKDLKDDFELIVVEPAALSWQQEKTTLEY